MRRKKVANPKQRIYAAIIGGVALIAITILVSYYIDQSKISGQKFGDDLAQIQTDLKNETLSFDSHLKQYTDSQISKDVMLKITDNHTTNLEKILSRYDKLKAPDTFGPSLQLFKLSTQKELESDQNLRTWIVTGDNSTRVKSDQLLQQAFQYEMNALQSYNDAKSKGTQ